MTFYKNLFPISCGKILKTIKVMLADIVALKIVAECSIASDVIANVESSDKYKTLQLQNIVEFVST